ncbi:autotransporter outer membrane beta-barrel domain-containing protein, partial [Serratia sp. DD3]|uniref:autotransporter outer membrane beta-barrel domain-containing protein n=1 Tax=Serratia sp. DD3 TaxID=1410619 RepID=UPI0005607A40
MNKVYKVIWNAVLRIFVVASELAKNKQKKSSSGNSLLPDNPQRLHSLNNKKSKLFKISAITVTLLSVFAPFNPVYAITQQQCLDMGTACALINNRADLLEALSPTGTATTLLLTQNVNYAGAAVVPISQNRSNRQNIIIDGGGHSITFGVMAFEVPAADNVPPTNWPGQNATLTFTNFSNFISTTGTTGSAHLVSAQIVALNMTVIMENNAILLNNKLVAFGPDTPSGTPNNNSILRLGDNGPSVLNMGAFRQWGVASKVELTGTLALTIIPGAFPAVFWSNANAANSIIHFTSTSDASFLSSVAGNANVRLTNGPANNTINADNATYNFIIDDGAKVNLNITGQNVLGISNFGVQIGSYDPLTGFGPGAVVQLNNWSNTTVPAPVINHQISNLPSTNATAAIFNGPTSPYDVIYNLATGSIIVAANNTLVSGIIARKTTGTGNIYIRSGALISDGTANVSLGTGITAETTATTATGNILVKNEGTILKATGILQRISSTVGTGKVINQGVITSTVAGINLLSNIPDRIAMSIDNTNGVINANTGSAINIGSANIDLDLLGGELNVNGTDPAINVNPDNAGTHTITGVNVNINSDATAITSGSLSTFNLYDNTFSTIDGALFKEISGLNFLYGTRNNIINISGAGRGIYRSFNGIDLTNAYLTINANGAGSIGLSTAGVQDGDANIIVGTNTIINSTAGSAIDFQNGIPQSLTNYGEINGSVSMGNSGNTIINNGTLYSLDSGSGDDTLTFNPNSISQGLIDLSDGNNTVNIYDGSYVNSINTASGDDIFNIIDLTPNSNTMLGGLDAGAGNNTLNFINSIRALNLATRLENFNNINIDATSIITLADSNNISSGSQVNLTDTTSQLLFGDTYNGQFGGILAGTGAATVQNGANVTLVNASPFLGDWTVDNGGILNASQEDQLGAGSVYLAGLLNLTTISNFNKQLIGSGTLHVDANNNSFGFGANVGLGFTGLMDMNNGSFALTPANAQVLSNATLRGSANSLITVPTGNSQIGNLSLNGGTIQFADGGVITTGLLNVEAASVVQLDTASLTDGNLLDLDVGDLTTLVDSSNTLSAGQLNSLYLQDLSGNALSNGSLIDYLQNGNLVAINTYNFALSSDPGLKISYAPTQIDLQTAQTLTLSSVGATDSTLSARVTGSGNLAIGSDNIALTLNNTLNDYTGNTSVNGGILNVGANQALGNTNTLTVANTATLNLSGYSQTVDSLVNDGSFNFAGGTLTLRSGGSSNSVGGLNGGGVLNINGGTFTVNGANSLFSAQTTIATGANATLNAADALGNSNIVVDGTLNLNGADTAFDNTLSGAGLVNINNDLVFTGNNQALSGAIDINANSSLTIDQTNQLGTADIDLTAGSSQLILDNLQGNLANTLSGVAGATVSVENGSNTTLIGTNTLFDGLFAIDGTSQLIVASDQPLGTATIDIATGGQFIFNNYLSGVLSALNNDITGTGTWLLNGSNIDLANNSHLSTFGGTVRINDGSSLTLDNQTALNANTIFDVVNGLDSLNIQGNAAFALANQLTGNGWVYVDNNGQSFDFTNSNNQFTGNLVLQNTQFVLNGLNTSTLTNADLTLDTGSNTTVGVTGVASNETIGNLSLNGGTLNFYGDLLNESTITTDNLLASSGIINIAGGITWNDAGSSLLNQMANNASMALIYANIATGIDNLTLHIDDTEVTNQSVASDLIQNNLRVAQGLYNYALSNTRGADNGLFLNFNLIQLNLIEDGQDALLVATDATPGSNHDLLALVTGAGGIVLDASAAPLTISNSGNNYSGTTRVTGGTVLLGASNSLGLTQLLTVDSNALLNMAGFTQTVGELNNLGALTLNGGTLTNDGLLTNAGTLNLAGGTLNLLGGGTSTATDGLAGAGNLNVSGGSLILSADNSTLSAITTIAAGADVTLTNTGTLGNGDINIAGVLNFNRDGSFGNRLRGNGMANTNANVQLTGNSDFIGTQSVNAGGTLTVTEAHNLGADSATVDLTTTSSTLVFDGLAGIVAQTLQGIAGSTVSIDNSADMSLTGNNTAFNGLFAIDGDSQLTVGLQQNLGNGAVDIANGSTLQFLNYAGNVPTDLANTLTGSGTWWINNSNITLADNTTRLTGFDGLIDINGNARLTLNELTSLNAATQFNVQGTGDNLDITTSGLFNFNYALTGSGTVNVDTAGQAFSFGNAVGALFGGDVHLNSSTFSLAGANTAALTAATLVLENGNTTTVGVSGTASNQTIGNLTLNGGTLQFYSGTATSAESTLTTDTFTANSGIIDILGPQSAPNTGGSLLNQIGNNSGKALIFSNNATNIDNLTLHLNGAAVPNQPLAFDLTQNSLTVAQGIYDYGLSNTRGTDNGLFLNFSLIQLNLIEDGANALVVATDANPGSNHDLSVLVTGDGGIVLDASAAPLTISNGGNTYGGTTRATGGTVLLGASNALGQTQLLTVDSDALFDMAGFTQTVGALDNLGALTLNGGTLNLLDGGTSTAADGLAGAGNLNVLGGSLILSADNSTLSAITTIASGADITLTNAGTLGDSDITVAGALNFNRDGSFDNQLSGDGVVNTNANVQLTGESDFIGTQAINAGGTLTVTQANNLGADSATVDLTTDTSTLVFNGLQGIVAQTLQGIAGSTVSIDNSADMSLTGDNSSFNGLFAIDGNSQLTVGLQQNLGNGVVDIASGSTLQFLNFAGNVPSMLANTLTGSGTWWLNNSNINLAGNTTRLTGFDGLIDINGNARLTLDELTSLDPATRFNVQGTGDNLDITTAG